MDTKKIAKLVGKIWNSPHYEDRLEYCQEDFMGMYGIGAIDAMMLQFTLHATNAQPTVIYFERDNEGFYLHHASVLNWHNCVYITNAQFPAYEADMKAVGFTFEEKPLPDNVG